METPDFSEDDRILECLKECADIEAFTHLMAHAHDLGVSAADFVREEPKRTSRKLIRKLCLKNRKRSLRVMVKSVMDSLWDRPVTDTSAIEALYGIPQPPGQPNRNGHHERKPGE